MRQSAHSFTNRKFVRVYLRALGVFSIRFPFRRPLLTLLKFTEGKSWPSKSQ